MPRDLYSGKVTNWFNRIGVAEVLIESATLHVGDEVIVTGPTTGVVSFTVTDLRVDGVGAEQAEKGVYCSIGVPLEGMPEDRINASSPLETGERIHPRRGDRLYLWSEMKKS